MLPFTGEEYAENEIRNSSYPPFDFDLIYHSLKIKELVKIDSPGWNHYNLELSKDQKQFPQYGGYYHIKSNLQFSPTDQLRISAGSGLVRQDIPGATHAILQYGTQSALQYELNNWLKIMIYGQRLWFFEEDRNNAFLYRNPMVPQTETGGIISVTPQKNISLNLGPRIIIDTQTPEKRNMKMFNFSIVFRF